MEKENINSFTILIENERSSDWNSVFVKQYGEPNIPRNFESNGRHWNHQDYNIDGMVKKISITMWINPKDKQSKLLIQSANHMMTMMWVSNELPNIFMDVMKSQKNKIENEKLNVGNDNPATDKIKYQCDGCDFASISILEIENHAETKHKKKATEPVEDISQRLKELFRFLVTNVISGQFIN